jgi:hypothetical protein
MLDHNELKEIAEMRDYEEGVEQGAVVEMVIGHKGFAESGGIGAFLRF